jgi:hypothetical protein
MTQPPITVTIQGLDKLKKVTRPELVLGPTSRAIRDLSLLAERTSKAAAPADTGALRRSITAQIKPLSARIGDTRDLTYFEVQERGQAPLGATKQHFPPPSALAGWARRHGFGTTPGALFVLARGIARRGFKGRFFMAKGRQSVQKALPGKLRRASKEIEKSWGQGRIR